jgi:BirA family biotin operon repressor/biotin-[acetyl-CoA-carboxylase] ligase
MIRTASDWEGLEARQLEDRWLRPRVHLYAHIDSTNTRAKRLAQSGAPSGTVVVADAQTAGRGIAQRRWHSPPGSGLYLSLILRPRRVPNALLIPLLAGLGAARAAERAAVGVRVGLKWPNDLIADDRKLGGVLVEGSWMAGTPAWLVIGVGVNVHMAAVDFPDVLRSVATSLDAVADRRVSRLALADSLIDEIEAGCGVLPERLDEDQVAQIAQRDWLRDRPCVLEAPGVQRIRGVAAGIEPDGALILRTDSGEHVAVRTGRIRTDHLPTPEY